MSTFSELQCESFVCSCDHGFWDSLRREDTRVRDDAVNRYAALDPEKVLLAVPEKLCLIHSELSEALEDFRSQRMVVWLEGRDEKPCGFPTELADAVIRIMDLCSALGIDLEKEIKRKQEYNRGRPYKHGRAC